MTPNASVNRQSSLPDHLTSYPSMLNRDISTELIRRASSEDDGRSTKRPRASKPKVKSGCITCKTRRVKCDETKPHCLRCQKFGRLCDGYSPEPSSSGKFVQLQPRIPSVTLYAPNASIHDNELENKYYHIFLEKTAHELSGYYDSSFWTRVVLQESHQSPAIRHAVIALGAITKSLENAPGPGLKVNVLQGTDAKHHERAVLFNLRAIQELNHYLSTAESPQLRHALIACLLFVCFETFQGSYATSVQQTYGGLKILRSYYMGRPGSRPWIPRRMAAESKVSKKMATAAKALQARGGCDNVYKDRTISEHVEEFIENQNAIDVNQKIKPPSYATEPHILVSPVYAVYDQRANHIDIPGMWTSNFGKSPPKRNGSIQPSKSHSIASPSSAQPPSSQLSRPPEVAPPNAPPSLSSAVSTPQSARTLSPAPSSAASSQVAVPNRKRPLASRSPTPNTLQNDVAIEESLIQSLTRIDGQGLFFGMLPGIPPLIWDIHQAWHLPIPKSFPDILAAQKCWDFMMDRTMQFYRRTLFNRAYAPSSSDPPDVLAKQYANFHSQLTTFDKAFRPLLDTAIDFEGHVTNPAVLVLSLYQKITMIFLSTLKNDSEMHYDSFLPDFQYITSTCALLVASEGPLQVPRNKRFSFDVGIIPPLHVVATKCRDPLVRRKAIDILFASPRQEGMWDGVLSGRIGKWMAKCEEEGLPPPPAASQQTQSPESRGTYSDSPSPPHLVEENNGWEHVVKPSEVALNEHIGHGIAEYGPAKEGGKILNSAAIRGNVIPRKQSPAREKTANETSMPEKWMIPEENRVKLMNVDFHMPDRHIRVKCQRVMADKNGKRVDRETIIAW